MEILNLCLGIGMCPERGGQEVLVFHGLPINHRIIVRLHRVARKKHHLHSQFYGVKVGTTKEELLMIFP